MKAFRRVVHAKTLREAIEGIPEGFYERVALIVLAWWLVVPLVLWWLGGSVGMDIRYLGWVDLQVGIGALALAALLLAAQRAGTGFGPARDPRRDYLPSVLFGVFLALALVASIVSPTESTWTGDGYRRESILTYVSYLGFFFLASQVLSPTRRRLLVALVLGLVSVTCIVTLVSAMGDGWGGGGWGALQRPTAYFHQFNHYGYLLAVGGALAVSGALVAARRAVRWGLVPVFGMILLTLLLNDTLGAYVALLAGCIVAAVWLAVIRRLRVKQLVAIVAVAVAVHVFAEVAGIGTLMELGSLSDDVRAVSGGEADAVSAGTGRWGLWVTTLEQVAKSPWIGHGVEGIAELLPVGFGRPHNEYLQYAVFFGIPALLAYLAAVITVLVRVARRGDAIDNVTLCAATAVATYLVSACFGNTMYYTAPLLFLLLGVAWGGVRLKGPARSVLARASATGDETAPVPHTLNP